MTPLLVADQIHKSFHYPTYHEIIRGVSLSVIAGESVAIVGRSGEGKSTLLQILGTLEQACSGSIHVCGESITLHNKNRIRNQSIGFVFQSFHLLEDYTVLDNVLMPAAIARKSISKGSEAYERGVYLLEKVGLAHRAHYQTKLLSGGEQQRASLARAMCNDPALLFADEPSGNLDRQTASLIHELMFAFVNEGQKALLLVTHDRDLARQVSTQYQLQSGLLEKV